MIIRRTESTLLLITQPAHAALSARIMQGWEDDHFPETPHKGSILHAIEQHDCGWAGFDNELIVDATTGRLLDFTEVPDGVKRATSVGCVHPLAPDPYAAALSAQHRLHVYRRYGEDPAWTPFFAELTSMRDAYLRSAGEQSAARLLRDYCFVRAGDLASLAFCNEWPETDADGCGYSMRMAGETLTIAPDPLGGRTLGIEITARVTANTRFGSAAEARAAIAAARVVTLRGMVRGAND